MSALQHVEFVMYTPVARDCVIDSYVIICGCQEGTVVTHQLTSRKVTPTLQLWAWQDNVASGNGFCGWQSNVSVHPEPMGRWSKT